jgi:hypothetical protein
MNRKAAPVDERTRDRLRAYCNRKLLESQSYADAINELLDRAGFPSATEIARDYRVVLEAGRQSRANRAGDETQTRTRRPYQTVSPDDRKSLPLDEPTRDRLLAFSNRNPPEEGSYDFAVNELLDMAGVPEVEVLYQQYSLVWEVVSRLGSEEFDHDKSGSAA